MSKRSPSPYNRRNHYGPRDEGRTRDGGERRYGHARDDRYDRREGPSRSSRQRSRSRDNGYSRPRDRPHESGYKDNGERRGDSGWGSRAQGSSARNQPIKRERSRSQSRSRSRSPPRKRKRSASREAPPGKELVRRSNRHQGDRDDDRRVRRRDRSEDARSDRGRARSASRLSDEDKLKPDFKNSGLLAAATNTVHRSDGTKTVLKYNEPPEARKPTEHWRLYDFEDEKDPSVLAVYKQSAFLFGRDAAVVDIPLNHPSCSKQHAAIQFRHVIVKNEFGDKKGMVKPFIIDLESTNGTHVNGETIPAARYYELKLNDVIKFGTSNREFVLLHEDVAP